MQKTTIIQYGDMNKLIKKYQQPYSGIFPNWWDEAKANLNVDYSNGDKKFDFLSDTPIDYTDIAYTDLPKQKEKEPGLLDKASSYVSKALDKVGSAVSGALNYPIQVQTMGTPTATAAFGRYAPKYNSTVGNQLAQGALSLASPLIPSAALAVATPGSTFWTNPLTRQMVVGTLFGEGINLGSQLVTGLTGDRRTWGQGVGDVVHKFTGYNPNNNMFGSILTDMTNPGYFISPNKVGLLSTIPKQPKFVSTHLTPIEDFIEYGDINSLNPYLSRLARATNVPESTISRIVSKYGDFSPLTPGQRGQLLKTLGYKWDDSVDLKKLGNGIRKELQDFHFNSLDDATIQNYIGQLKDQGIKMGARTARKVLSRGFANPENSTKTIGDFIDTINFLPEVNFEKYLSPEVLEQLQKRGLSPKTLRFALKRTYADAPSGVTKDYIDNLFTQYYPEQIKLLEDLANFSLDRGFSSDPYKILGLGLKGVGKFHPNIPRPEAGQGMSFTLPNGHPEWLEFRLNDRGKLVTDMPTAQGYKEVPALRAIRTNVDNIVQRASERPFTGVEYTGMDFSSSSMPMIWENVDKISNIRAANGQFPGIIQPLGGITYGNSFGNVNLGTKEFPRIAYGLPYGKTPSTDVIRTYPNRKQAMDAINLKAAQTYKTIQKNSKYPGAPDYGFDEGLLDKVIQAKGDINAVPGAEQMMFKDGITPLWTTFPEHSEVPIYPNLRFLLKDGGKVKNKLIEHKNKARVQ